MKPPAPATTTSPSVSISPLMWRLRSTSAASVAPRGSLPGIVHRARIQADAKVPHPSARCPVGGVELAPGVEHLVEIPVAGKPGVQGR
jgi:hypothetical protein